MTMQSAWLLTDWLLLKYEIDVWLSGQLFSTGEQIIKGMFVFSLLTYIKNWCIYS